jgi:hypothetical protein
MEITNIEEAKKYLKENLRKHTIEGNSKTYIVKLYGKTFCTYNNKASWDSIGAAKNAIHNSVYEIDRDTLKELFKDGTFKFVEYKND